MAGNKKPVTPKGLMIDLFLMPVLALWIWVFILLFLSGTIIARSSPIAFAGIAIVGMGIIALFMVWHSRHVLKKLKKS
ncbi:MAG: hypothetical protein ACHQX1_01175 [Candidatus Micrarchaeales archaeon]